MAKYLEFLRRMVSTKDEVLDSNYARVQCFKVLTSFREYDAAEYEKMQQYAAEIIKKSPGDYLRVSYEAKGLIFTTLLHLLVNFSPEDLYDSFMRYYQTLDSSGKFKLTKTAWERGLNKLAQRNSIGKGKMMKAVTHMGGKSLIDLGFLKQNDKVNLLDPELSARIFQSLAVDEEPGSVPIIDWRKYLPYVFAFYCHWEASELISRYEEMRDIMGIPMKLEPTGELIVHPEGAKGGLLAQFHPYIPVDSTKIALEPTALLDYELRLPFLTYRYISEALQAFHASSSFSITTADIGVLCEKIQTDYPASSLISDELHLNLTSILPRLTKELCAMSRLRKQIKGQNNLKMQSFESIAAQTAFNLNLMTDDQLVTRLIRDIGSSESEQVTGTELGVLLRTALQDMFPSAQPSVLQRMQQTVEQSASEPLSRSSTTAETVLEALKEALATELDSLFAYFIEKFDARATQHSRKTPQQLEITPRESRFPSILPLKDLINKSFLRENQYKIVIVTIAKAVNYR